MAVECGQDGSWGRRLEAGCRDVRADLFQWLRAWLPPSVKRWFWRSGCVKRFAKLDPTYDPDRVHLITAGVLAGHRLLAPFDSISLVKLPYEPDVCQALKDSVKPGAVCLDVGAHVGYMTLLMAKLVGPHGRVHAIEANPDNVELLRRNIQLNGYSERVRVLHMAAVDRDAASLWFERGHTSLCGRVSRAGGASGWVVPARCLDTQLAGLSRLDLVKIDVEGGEDRAIHGAIGLLRRLKPLVLLEAHGDQGRHALRVLQEQGYMLTDPFGQPIELQSFAHPIHVVARHGP